MSPGRRSRRGAALAGVALALLAGSCGYSTARLTEIGPGRTVAVIPFENAGFRRYLERRLTMALLEEIRARTSFGLASPASADYLLEGTVWAGESLSIVRGDRTAAAKQYRGGASVRVKDRRTGKVLKSYEVLASPEFTPGEGGESLEGTATDELVRRLAIRIVQGLERGF